jgi:hypothetical protein
MAPSVSALQTTDNVAPGARARHRTNVQKADEQTFYARSPTKGWRIAWVSGARR